MPTERAPTERATERAPMERAPKARTRIGRAWARLSMALATLGLASTAWASFGLAFDTPEPLRVGDRARLVLVVDVATDVPVLVTPTHEGSAVEVVRGRLARADAVEPGARPLRFPIPVVARERGAGVVRARVTSFECVADRCEALEEEARISLRVEGP